MLEETLGTLDDDVFLLAQDGQWVAKCRRIVILQDDDAARHNAHITVGVRERGECADGIVVARDEVLHDELGVVVRHADCAPDLLELFGRLDFVDLALRLNRGRLEFCRIRWFGDQRVVELVDGKFIGTVAAIEVPRLGEGHVELFAQLVESAFLRDLVEQVEINVGNGDARCLKALFATRKNACMHIVAAKHNQLAFRVARQLFGRDGFERLEGCVAFVQAIDQAIVGELAAREHLDVLCCQHDRPCDSKCTVHFAHPAVCENVATYDDGLKVLCDIDFYGHMSFPVCSFRPIIAFLLSSC